jgi:hypothetical protein
VVLIFDMLPESGTQQEFLERRLWRNSKEPSRLNGGLKIRRVQKFLGPQKLACADSARTTDLMVWYRKIFGLLLNALLDVSRVLNSK